MRSEWNGPHRVVAHRYSVVYDSRTGKIVHVHESTAIEGAEIPADHLQEKRAIEFATRFSGDRDGGISRRLAVLTVDAPTVTHDGPVKADVKKRVLTATAIPPKVSRAPSVKKRPAPRVTSGTKTKAKAKTKGKAKAKVTPKAKRDTRR